MGDPVLGPLETRLLELLWSQRRPATVRHIRRALPQLAYTTIMTTLDRLYRKGLLLRHKDGRAFAYAARCTRAELLSELFSGHVADLLGAAEEGTALEGPASPPAGASTPDTRLRAVAISWASRARSSSPETTERVAGIRSIGSGIRVAVTVSTLGTPSLSVMEGGSAASVPWVATTRRALTIHR